MHAHLSARTAAFDILLRVEQTDAFASELLHSPGYSKLAASDHGLATELVMGVLRWKPSLDQELAAASTLNIDKLDVEVLTALRIAAYQLKFLNRIPGRAAVHESVELVKRARKRSAAAFVNAVLRKLVERSRVAASPPANAEELATQSAHPRWLVERWIAEFGFANAATICAYDQQTPQAAIRLGEAETPRNCKPPCKKKESSWPPAACWPGPAGYWRATSPTSGCFAGEKLPSRTKLRNWWPCWWAAAKAS